MDNYFYWRGDRSSSKRLWAPEAQEKNKIGEMKISNVAIAEVEPVSLKVVRERK
jgi:hypothetical protein